MSNLPDGCGDSCAYAPWNQDDTAQINYWEDHPELEGEWLAIVQADDPDANEDGAFLAWSTDPRGWEAAQAELADWA